MLNNNLQKKIDTRISTVQTFAVQSWFEKPGLQFKINDYKSTQPTSKLNQKLQLTWGDAFL